MKKHFSSGILLFLICSLAAQAQPRLKMDWGVESKQVYEELAGNSGLRVFLPKSDALDEETASDCRSRHEGLWKQYRDSCKKNSKQPDRAEFISFKKEQDSFCTGYYIKIAPVLYFDFIANNSGEEYVLDSLQVEITARNPARKAEGGFIANEAFYDIVLPDSDREVKSYAVQKKLVFRGHGRLQLRLWSGTLVPEEGWVTRSAAYVLNITFKFLVNGAYVESHTGAFSIVV